MRVLLIALICWSGLAIYANLYGWPQESYSLLLDIGRPLSLYSLCFLIIWGGCDIVVSLMERRWRLGRTLWYLLEIVIIALIMVSFRVSIYL